LLRGRVAPLAQLFPIVVEFHLRVALDHE
jgi:hypothetical protein